MKIQLTVRFDSRDWADLALMRLRRNGIEFSMAKVTVPREKQNTEFPEDGGRVLYPFSLGAMNMDGLYFPLFGAQAVLSRGLPNDTGEAVLQLKVSLDQLPRAREILINAHGRDISIK
ncbi:MAG: hypothetical protein ACOX7I_06305 [Oscillospiraceae bacterium]|jgi:hypothetical protein